MSTLDPDNRPLILEAGRADHQYWIDLWRYRELFFILAWRDVAVRYKQTIIGIAWACGERMWMNWMSRPSICVTYIGSALSRASIRRQS